MAASQKPTVYRFKDITTVPNAKDLVDIVLSQTQRRTPTQDIHPFYGDLCNVLYDRDHYKLALGQVNTVRGVVDHIAKDYVRLLKYADSPYKCKMLKRAALGRMCTGVRKLSESLKYLEEVRQHLSRLPSINPNTRTLILAGYPNVGKSSFINSVTRANVEVQPYAFTTKSLFIGHFDYGYARWQCIDTPGILDHPLASRNTIELTAITALAHIQASVLFLIDVSEQCGFSIEDQVSLFHNIKALFKSKPLLVVLNKVDVVKLEDLNLERQALIKGMIEGHEDAAIVETSCLTALGIERAKNKACEMLMTKRIEAKILANRIEPIENRLHVTNVSPPIDRPPNIPESVLMKMGKPHEDDKAILLRDVEESNGGPGVFSIDLNKEWQLKNDNWRYDKMPEVFEGKNVLDFVDPEVEKMLELLEQEEAHILRENHGIDIDDDTEWKEASAALKNLHGKIELKRIEKRMTINHTKRIMPRTSKPPMGKSAVRQSLLDIGYEVENSIDAPIARPLRRLTGGGGQSDTMSDDDTESQDSVNSKTIEKKSRSPVISMRRKLRTFSLARTKGIKSGNIARAISSAKSSQVTRLTKSTNSPSMIRLAEKIKRRDQKIFRATGRKGEADRFIGTKKPKHLYSGKRGIGKTDFR